MANTPDNPESSTEEIASPPPKQARLGRQATIWDCGAICVGLATLFAHLGAFWWLFDLCSHFRVQYFAGSLLLLIVFGRRKEPLKLGLMAGCAALNFWVIQPKLQAPPLAPRTLNAETVTAVWWNVYSSGGDVQEFLKWVEEHSPDLLALGEITPEWQTSLAPLATEYPHQHVEARTDNFGIALLSRKPLFNTETIAFGQYDIPSISTQISLDGRALNVLVTHPVPPIGGAGTRNRNDQLQQLAERITAAPQSVMLLGDLNATPWNHAFKTFLKQTGLKDPTPGLVTTWPPRLLPLRIQIDHCLLSPSVKAHRYEVGPKLGSDHNLLHVEVGW